MEYYYFDHQLKLILKFISITDFISFYSEYFQGFTIIKTFTSFITIYINCKIYNGGFCYLLLFQEIFLNLNLYT